jgi:hypothetical protein
LRAVETMIRLPTGVLPVSSGRQSTVRIFSGSSMSGGT